ncbi:hypothetical protein [Natrinema thermotolerans]
MVDSSRRAFLAGGIAAGSIGIAGCTGDIPGLGTDDGNGEDEGTSLPSFHSWLYAPEAVGIGPYTYTYADGETLEDGTSDRSSPNIGWALETIRYGDNEQFDDVDHAVSIDYREERTTFGAVIAGGFDVAEIQSEINESTTEEDDVETATHRSYDVYYDDQYAIAIGDESLPTYLMGNAGDAQDATGRDIVETMIDARAGDAARLHAGDESADRLLREQGERTVVFGAPTLQGDAESLFESAGDDETPAVEAAGFTLDADEEDTDYRVTVITADPVDDTGAFADTLSVLEWFDEPTSTQEGVVLTYEEGATGDGDPDGEESPPEVSFAVEIDRGTARITHTGGETIPVSDLAVRFERDGRTQTIPFESVSSVDDVRPGHTTTVGVDGADPGSELRVVWTPGPDVLYVESVPRTTNSRPDASFAVEIDRGTARITHTDGETIPVSDLAVRFERDGQTQTIPFESVSSVDDVRPGHTTTVGVDGADPGSELRVVWTPGPAVLHVESVPETSSSQLNASFAIEFDLSRDTATVHHTGGDSVPADELDVVVHGERSRDVAWSELSSDRTVERGDSVTVDLTEGDYGGLLFVGWRPEGEILERREIPSP